jgi:hypothetical protein
MVMITHFLFQIMIITTWPNFRYQLVINNKQSWLKQATLRINIGTGGFGTTLSEVARILVLWDD